MKIVIELEARELTELSGHCPPSKDDAANPVPSVDPSAWTRPHLDAQLNEQYWLPAWAIYDYTRVVASLCGPRWSAEQASRVFRDWLRERQATYAAAEACEKGGR